MTLEKFFSAPDRASNLAAYQAELMQHTGGSEMLRLQQNHLLRILESISLNSVEYDECCQVSIQDFGRNLIERVREVLPDFESRVTSVMCLIYRFVVEFDLCTYGEKHDLREFQEYVLSQLGNLEGQNRQLVEYARQELPSQVLKFILNDPALGSLKNVRAYSSQVDQIVSDWEKRLSQHRQEVGELKTALDSYKTGFNFVGLSQGFQSLKETKEEEIKVHKAEMKNAGRWVFVPLLLEFLYFMIAPILSIDLATYQLAAMGLISVSLTLLLVYFFRLSVRSVDMCKAQLLQIQLRMTLCQFIQDYGRYSKELKESNGPSLDKFESLIFSGIVSNDEKLPATFDGFEQVANLVKTMRGP